MNYNFWHTFRWFLLALFIFLMALTSILGIDLWINVWKEVSSTAWWATNLPVFLVFTLVVGAISWMVNVIRERENRLKFENFKLLVFWQGNITENFLYWEDVRRIKSSDFELWKFVKSVISGVGTTNQMTIIKAKEAGWCQCGDDSLIVNLDKALQKQHITLRPSKKEKSSSTSKENKSVSENPDQGKASEPESDSDKQATDDSSSTNDIPTTKSNQINKDNSSNDSETTAANPL